jgi:POT family proton-dependent oligopeptide transporter
MPKGIPYIVGNEAAERFSYYGMRTILVIFMTKYLLDSEGNPDVMTGEQANVWFHTFTMAVYFFPFLGAILADAFLGKYRTILSLSVVYVLGHAVLAIADTSIGASIVEPRTSLAIGLGLIAFGSGGIKPCVSAHVGDQFGKSNAPLLERVFQWFYFSINLGSTISTLLTPWLLAEFGPHIAFGIPGILMFLATVVFWMGRKVFIHIPPGGTTFLKETFSKTGLATLGKLAIIYVFLFPFWALFDQTGSSWVLQAERMDRHLGIEWLSSQIQATNPILVMILIPIFGYGIYPAINKFFPLTPIRKIAIGLFVTVPSFLIIAYAEMLIQDGGFPSIGWQLLAYLVITAAEVMVSITALEFSYTQAPKTMKSVVMATFFFSIVVGNFAVALTNQLIQNPQPSFVADAPGLYTVELAANDGTDRVVERGTIEVVREKEEAPATPPADKPPSAEAGQIVAVAPGTEVRLYASADDGDARGDSAYAWAFESKPAGSRIEDDDLRDAHTRNPTFTPDVAGEYVLEFRYRVGDQAASDTVTIHATTENMPPVVAVSLPEVVELSDEPIALDGSSTFDPNGDTLRYYWRFVDVPAASELSDDDLIGRHYPTATSTMDGPDYFLFFAGLMFLCALLFIPVGYFYKEKTYIQDEDDGAAAPAADVAVETPGHDGDDDDGGNDGGNDDEPRARG